MRRTSPAPDGRHYRGVSDARQSLSLLQPLNVSKLGVIPPRCAIARTWEIMLSIASWRNGATWDADRIICMYLPDHGFGLSWSASPHHARKINSVFTLWCITLTPLSLAKMAACPKHDVGERRNRVSYDKITLKIMERL